MSYTYKARVVRVIDGDTVVLNVDLGFRTWHESPFRLFGINAPEINTAGPAGEAARDHLRALLPLDSMVRAHTYRSADKYGRWLVNIWREDNVNVNERMVSDGHAVYYDGGPR